MKKSNEIIAQEVAAKAILWRGVRRSDPVLQVRAKMREKGIKSVDLAERLGVSTANVSRWLRGHQNLSLDTLYSIADAIEEPLSIVVGNISYSYETNSESGWREESDCNDIWCSRTDNVVDMSVYLAARSASMKRSAEAFLEEKNESLVAFA